ncbi:unnamed protein product [Arabidopsis halleri]
MDNNSNDEAKHTVYISFNKNDSSVSSFISYLIAAFNRQGIISAFVDGKSSHDEAVEREMGPEEFSKLRVVVVVFSKNYALHVSFLEKQILEFSYRNNNDFVVVPVFYGVSVSSVKQHMERFGEEFDAVQRSMIKWRPGHEYDCKRSESEFLEEIARDVFEQLYPTEEIGIQSLLKEIVENYLCNQPWGIRTIGIFGEPGIGKTTLATAFFRRISHGYDDSCFIKDFHTEYTEKRLEYMPPKYLGKTSMENFDLKSFDSQPSHRKKWVLVALDDVQNAQDAKSFLGGYDKFGPGSLIIITSRDKSVLEQCHMNKIYELKGLNDEDALKLFTRCAFGNGVIEQNHLDLSKRVVECSDGNPRTLRSFADKFKGKAVEKISWTYPDDCDVFVAGDDGSCDTEKNTYFCIVPCEEDDEVHENKELQSDHNAVLATRDSNTIIVTPSDLSAECEFRSYSQKNPGFGIYNRISKSLPSNLKVYRLDYNSLMRSLYGHLHQKHHVLLQGFAGELQKRWKSFSNSHDHDQLEHHLQLLLNLSGGCVVTKICLEVVRKTRELNGKNINGIKQIRYGNPELLKIKLDRDQPNGLGQYISN